MGSSSAGTSGERTLSMVEMAEPVDEFGVARESVVFASWVDVAALSGRVVHLDGDHRSTAPA